MVLVTYNINKTLVHCILIYWLKFKNIARSRVARLLLAIKLLGQAKITWYGMANNKQDEPSLRRIKSSLFA
jgi:hypothetical protein